MSEEKQELGKNTKKENRQDRAISEMPCINTSMAGLFLFSKIKSVGEIKTSVRNNQTIAIIFCLVRHIWSTIKGGGEGESFLINI